VRLSISISCLGIKITVTFSIGAVITMYASVSSRVAEIGTLRLLAFRRSGVLYAFMAESLMLGLVGRLIGLVFASLMQFASSRRPTFRPTRRGLRIITNVASVTDTRTLYVA